MKKFALGRDFTLCVNDDRKLYVSGSNASQVSGLAQQEDIMSFKPVTTLPPIPVVQVATGMSHSLVLLANNTLWTAGDNRKGLLGLSRLEPDYLPFTQIESLPKQKRIVQIVASDNYSMALLEDGTVWVAGSNNEGVLGMEARANFITFTKVTSLPVDKRVIMLAAGQLGSFVQLEDDSIWVAGTDEFGQLGLAGKMSNVYQHLAIFDRLPPCVAIATASKHSVFLLADGTVWALGCIDDLSPMGQPASRHQGLKEGCYSLTQINLPFKAACVVDIAVSNRGVTFIITSDGKLWGAGNGFEWQLGLGHQMSVNGLTQITTLPQDKRVQQVVASDGFTFVVLEDGSVWCAGNNASGQLGLSHLKARATKFTLCPIPEVHLKTLDKVPSLQRISKQAYQQSPPHQPYSPDAFKALAAKTTVEIAKNVFMPHLLGCPVCQRYVKPTTWGQCPYPHPKVGAAETDVGVLNV